MSEEIIKQSIKHGFSQAYLLPLIEFNNIAFSAKKIMDQAQSVLLLIKKHNPYEDFPKTSMSVHSHYPAYQTAYNMHHELIDTLRDMGIKAESANSLPQKSYAVSAGLWRLKNSLIFHPEFGTYFVMQTIVTDQKPMKYNITDNDFCSHCDACVKACPTNAIGEDGLINQKKCIRSHVPVKESIPEYLRVVAKTNYIGCGICQAVCPLNSKIKEIAPEKELVDCLDINDFLDITKNKQNLDTLANLIGKNEVRPSRAISTACLCAANTKDERYLKNLEAILLNYISPLARGYAAVAIGKIGSGNDILLKALKHEKDTFVKIAIASALLEE